MYIHIIYSTYSTDVYYENPVGFNLDWKHTLLRIVSERPDLLRNLAASSAET